MNKKYLKSVGIVLFLAVFFAVNSCSKSDDNHVEDSEGTEVALPAEALRLQIVEASFSEPLTQEEYDGTLGDVSLKLVRESEQTLLFYIPGTVPVGEVVFSIPELKVSQKLNVKNAELRAAESVVLAPFFEKTSTQYQGISTPEYMTYMTEVNIAFDNYYQSLSAAEKDEMALFFQVNEAFFDEVLNIDVNGVRSVESTVRNVAKFTIASYLFVTCSTALTLPGTPVEKAVIGAVAVTGAVKAWDYGKQLISEVNIVNSMTQQILDEISATTTTALDDSASLTFVHGESKSVNFYIEQQNMTSANRSGTAESLVSFFDAYDVLTSATHTVNDVIRFINDHVFFANISEIPISEIPANAEKETTPMTSELFNYLTFSTPDNVILSQPSFANGGIAMKITIANPDNVTDGVVQTQLNYTYEDAFNHVSGSIPVEVKLEPEDPCEGSTAPVILSVTRVCDPAHPTTVFWDIEFEADGIGFDPSGSYYGVYNPSSYPVTVESLQSDGSYARVANGPFAYLLSGDKNSGVIRLEKDIWQGAGAYWTCADETGTNDYYQYKTYRVILINSCGMESEPTASFDYSYYKNNT